MQQQYDERNDNIMVYVGGALVPRSQAKVSVFDSSVQGGDAVWEGLRVYNGRIAFLDEHLDRLLDSAHALMFTDVPTIEQIKATIFETLAANKMRDHVHIRLTLTRGEKITSGMDPRLNQSGCCLIVLAEWKPPVYSTEGIRLITAATRRNSPAALDSKIHHNNLLNNILAKIEANVAGADDALMLDMNGFVAETNATNVFIVKERRLRTPHANACLPGITRGVVLKLARQEKMDCRQRNLSLSQLYAADEMFVSGTMGELTAVLELDGRKIGNGQPGPVTERLSVAYLDLAFGSGERLP